MKIAVALLYIFLTPMAFAATDSAIARFDALLQRRNEVESRPHQDRDVEDIYRELVLLAYTDLMAHENTVFDKGMDSRWAERLASLPQGPHERFLRDDDVGSITKELLVNMEECTPPLGAHLLQRCWISRVLAYHFMKKRDMEAAVHHIHVSTSYLDIMEEHMAGAIAKMKMNAFIQKSRDENQKFLSAVLEKQKTRREMALPAPSSNDSSSRPPGPVTKSDKPAIVAKTFTVTSDARANQTGDEAGASGESGIVIRGEEGSFTVRYWYDWPSAYLMPAARDRSLVGLSVRVYFEGEKPTHVSCDAGNGRCEIKSFSRR